MTNKYKRLQLEIGKVIIGIFYHPSNFYSKKLKGFTLIETLVAMAILVIAVIVPLSLAFRNVSTVNFTKDQIIATYLAQDALEHIIATKKQNLLRDSPPALPVDWLNGLYGENPSGNPPPSNAVGPCIDRADLLTTKVCTADTSKVDIGGSVSQLLTECPSTCVMKYNTSFNRYGYESGSDWKDTKFTRTVKITKILTDSISSTYDEARVKVTVSWRSNLFNTLRSVTIYTNIYKSQI